MASENVIFPATERHCFGTNVDYHRSMLPEIVMFQNWSKLLFAHWRVDPAELRILVPESFELDLWEGAAWVGLIPFTMSGIRARGAPPIPGLSSMHEVNVRTYVRHGELSGVWFFSLDATSRAAVEVARRVYELPYHHARIELDAVGGWNHYRSSRSSATETGCNIVYRGTGRTGVAEPGSFDEFLIERYNLFASRGDRTWTARVYHDPYPLQAAEVSTFDETLVPQALTGREESPVLHYSEGVSVRIGRLHRL